MPWRAKSKNDKSISLICIFVIWMHMLVPYCYGSQSIIIPIIMTIVILYIIILNRILFSKWILFEWNNFNKLGIVGWNVCWRGVRAGRCDEVKKSGAANASKTWNRSAIFITQAVWIFSDGLCGRNLPRFFLRKGWRIKSTCCVSHCAGVRFRSKFYGMMNGGQSQISWKNKVFFCIITPLND